MSIRPRRDNSPAFEAQVALAALKGEKPLAELAQQFACSPSAFARQIEDHYHVSVLVSSSFLTSLR